MPSVSTPTRRPLAALDTNVNSPLHRQTKNSPHVRSKLANSPRGNESLPLTPSSTPKFPLPRSTSVLAPSNPKTTGSARKFDSFSDYTMSRGRNVKADLAATKLKLRLQLAFYKLKSQKDANEMKASPEITVSPTCIKDSNQQTFRSSANVNLRKPRVSSGPSLTTVASRKANNKNAANVETQAASDNVGDKANPEKNNSSMRLYHIKPSSAYHNSFPQKLPLNTNSSQRLPPVHKILKTPIKSTTRNMINQYLSSKNERYGTSNPTAHTSSGNHLALPNIAANNGDETIDETNDETTVDYHRSNNGDMLGSSPSRSDTFSTPNSFSVAKSLLQLGSGFY